MTKCLNLMGVDQEWTGNGSGMDQEWTGNGVRMDWEQIRNEKPFPGMDRTFRNGQDFQE
jgi:hypothetical protein